VDTIIGDHQRMTPLRGANFTTLVMRAPEITITSITKSGGNVVINWTGGDAPYVVKKRANVNSGVWTPVQTTYTPTATLPIDSDSAFFRVR
jgi:hypothetical protein